jgi:hypothetical protein
LAGGLKMAIAQISSLNLNVAASLQLLLTDSWLNLHTMKMGRLKPKTYLSAIFSFVAAWLQFWTANILLLRWGIVWNVAKMLLAETV